MPNRVVLWTRITPEDPAAAGNVPVSYVVATDPELSNVVASGTFVTNADRDFTVKVDPTGLMSFTTYYYQFRFGEAVSPVGRTKTAPLGSEAEQLRFAVVSCSNYTFGYFNAYGAIAQRPDLDAIIHLGDYLYEGGEQATTFTGRDHVPNREIITLDDYRQRHAQYRQDPDLAEATRQHPLIPVWDDHESTNNSYRDTASNHTEQERDENGNVIAENEGIWFERKGIAVRAYFEWLPIRDNVPLTPDNFDSPADDDLASIGLPPAQEKNGLLPDPDGNGRIFRRLAYGDLMDLIMLDTRLSDRDVELDALGMVPESAASPDQSILGEEQRSWFLNQLTASTAQWKVVGQQVTFAPFISVPGTPVTETLFINPDAWDGYLFDRNAVFDTLETNNINNFVMLSGDTHSATAFDLPRIPDDLTQYNPLTGEGSRGVEFSSNGIANQGVFSEAQLATNPHLKFANVTNQGYLLLDVNRQRVQGDYYFTGVPNVRSPLELFARGLASSDGSNRFDSIAALPTAQREDAPPLAPTQG